MRFARSILIFPVLAAFSCPAAAQVAIDKPWVRATAPGARVAGGYMVIRNQGTVADRLLSASSPAAAKVELHVHINDNGVMKMREAPAYDVPARGAFELRPGGAHLMFVEVKRPFKEGEKVPVKLTFEKAGEVNTEFQIGRLGGSAPPVGRKY